ncbi:MAG: MFS transporter [Dehalococcoidales bacterium]|nr:MFS transporter [Dehalococcoidales bacterium]
MSENKVNPAHHSGSRFYYGYIIVILGFLCLMVSAGLWDSFGVFMKPLLGDFDWTRATVSSSYSLSFLIFGLMGVIAGGLTDRFGPRLVLTFCGLFLGAGYLLMSQLNSLWQIFLFEGVIIGVGMSGLYAPIVGMVARWFVKRRGLMTGVVLAGLGCGQLVGPIVISRLIDAHDWRLTYIFLGIVILVFLVVSTQFLRRDPSQMGLKPFGADEIRQQSSGSVDGAYSLAEATHTWQFWIMMLIKLCYGYYMFSFVVHIVPHGTDLGISPVNAAILLSISGGGVVIGNFVLGQVVDKIGPRKVFMLCFAAAMAMMLWLTQSEDLWILAVIGFIIGLANAGNMTSDSPLGVRLFGLKSIGSIVGASSGAYSVGAAIGPICTGYIFDSTGSYQLAFLIAAIFCVCGLVLAAVIRPTERSKTRL